MRSISATEAKQNLGALLDTVQHEPVVIRRQKRDVAVVLSPREYDRLRAVNVAEFDRFCDRIGDPATEAGLTEAKLTKIFSESSSGCGCSRYRRPGYPFAASRP